MTTQSISDALTAQLEESPVRRQFVEHPFFRRANSETFSRDQAAVVVGQWWHPLHYFPTFLARCVAVLPDIEAKSAITRILSQETGGGIARQAHEVIYIHTMQGAGFNREQIDGTTPFEETAALVAGYERGSAEAYAALGFIFATEVTDLLMVSSIGKAVSGATSVQDLEWVDIHVEQEPDHVEEANHSLGNLSESHASRILQSAEEMWRLWTGFFDRLEQEISRLPAPVRRATVTVSS